jgi:AI-2 transport protein TqsA
MNEFKIWSRCETGFAGSDHMTTGDTQPAPEVSAISLVESVDTSAMGSTALQPIPRDLTILTRVATVAVIVSASWYLLKELAGLWRPLFFAIFLCYTIVPSYRRVRQQFPGPWAIAVVAGVCAMGLILMAIVFYSSAVGLNLELTRLIDRAGELTRQLELSLAERFPAFKLPEPASGAEPLGAAQLRYAGGVLLTLATDGFVIAIEVGFYLLFLLLEANRLPRRVETSFSDERGRKILEVVSKINEAMAAYLAAKMQASLGIGISVTLACWLFGVKFALLWGVLTFFGNFVPYLGSIVACGLNVLYIALQAEMGWKLVVASIVLIAIHILWRDIIEPSMTGRMVNLSPLVILAALAFWGLCGGMIGMILAVPLTVMLKIVLENLDVTRPFARMLADE